MSVLSNGPFSYNRFDGVNVGDSVNSAYHAIYEKKAKPDFLDMDKDGDKKEPFKKAVNDKKKGCSDCEGDCKCDDKKEYVKENRSLTKEDVIAHLIDEGFANNPVSAEVLLTHMSDEWLQSIEEGMLEPDMKKRQKNNEKAVKDMKNVKDDTTPRWMQKNG
jgi:hypothetical protein